VALSLDGADSKSDEQTLTNTRTEESNALSIVTPLRTNSTLTHSGREFVQLEPDDRQLFIKTVTPELPYSALQAHCSKAAGFSHLILSDPNPLKKFYRFGWICFNAADDIIAGEKLLAESTVDNFTLHLQHNTTAIKLRTLIAPGTTNSADRLAKDLEQVRKAAATFEGEAGELGGSQAIETKYQTELGKLDDNKESVGDAQYDKGVRSLVKRTLDLYLHYLRTVHASCYYCAVRADFPEQLHRRCAAHYRRPHDNQTTKAPTAEKWERDLDDRLPLWIDKDHVEPAQFGGESPDAALLKACEPFITKEDESKFRCADCSKLFSAEKFMVKHIQTKHAQLIEGKVDLDRLAFVNNYALDPAKLSFPPDQPPAVQSGRMSMAGPALPAHALTHYPQPMGPPMPIHQAVHSIGGGVGFVGVDLRGSPMGGYGGGAGDGRARRMRDPAEDREGRVRREGPAPPPPVGARMDPRAAGGARSYDDLDGEVGGKGEVVLNY